MSHERHTLFASVAGRDVPLCTGEPDEVAALAERFGAAGVEGVRVEAGIAPGWPPQAHVSAQQAWHDDVTITLDRDAAAVIAAAAHTAAHTDAPGEVVVHLICADGEGYRLVLRVEDPDSERVDAVGRPVWSDTYTDPIAGGEDWVRTDPQVAKVLDAFDALDLEGRAGLDDALAAALGALRTRCRGPLLADDDPRASA